MLRRMQLYPIFLSLKSCHALVVGAGVVGRRKIASLRAAGIAKIAVFDPGLSPDALRELADSQGVTAYAREVEDVDILGRTLVFAATNNSVENLRIARLCASLNVLCNVADDPQTSTFHVPATAASGDLALAVSTGGLSPALAKRIKEEALAWMESSYGALLTLMGRLRPMVLAQGWPTEENTALFRSVVNSPLGDVLRQGDVDEARKLLMRLLPEALHDHAEELLHELF